MQIKGVGPDGKNIEAPIGGSGQYAVQNGTLNNQVQAFLEDLKGKASILQM